MKYVIAEFSSWYTPERVLGFWHDMCELDPALNPECVDYAKAGAFGDEATWFAFRVKNGDAQKVVDAATYSFAEDPIPWDQVTLDEHDVEVVATKQECSDLLDEVSMSKFLGVL